MVKDNSLALSACRMRGNWVMFEAYANRLIVKWSFINFQSLVAGNYKGQRMERDYKFSASHSSSH